MSEEKTEISPLDAAAKILDENRQVRVLACQKALEELLQKHGCILEVGAPQVVGSGLFQCRISLVAK